MLPLGHVLNNVLLMVVLVVLVLRLLLLLPGIALKSLTF